MGFSRHGPRGSKLLREPFPRSWITSYYRFSKTGSEIDWNFRDPSDPAICPELFFACVPIVKKIWLRRFFSDKLEMSFWCLMYKWIDLQLLAESIDASRRKLKVTVMKISGHFS